MNDDTPPLSPQQVVLRNAMADLLDGQLHTYSIDRISTVTTAAHAVLTGREIEQLAFGVHALHQLLLHVRAEVVARRAALTPPAPQAPLH